jgi:glyoxylase-like metal-dependent hydrolase (beta-lactamase superfamily II)
MPAPIRSLLPAAAAIALLAACATTGSSGDAAALIDRAVAAQGGEAALSAIRSVEIAGTSKHWEPEQSHIAGGDMRFAAESTFILRRDLAADATRIEWLRKLAYPAPREYRFNEVLAGGSGFVQGIDSTARTKQNLDANPPSHTMSRMRTMALARELQRSSPTLLLQMKADAANVSAAPDIQVGGQKLKAATWAAGGRNFTVMFGADGLPARIRTLDYDSIQGNSTYDLVLADWREIGGGGGAKLAFQQTYQLNGRAVIETKLDAVRANPLLPANAFDIPADFRAKAGAAPLTVPYQWVLRRQFIGTYLDSDGVAFDPAVSTGMRLQDIAPGVALTQGVTHNSMVVEMRDHLVVFDAPVGDAYSNELLKQLAAKYPGKPVRTVVLTHHHMDHASGARAYVAQGATLVVGAGNGEHFRRMIQADHSRSPDGAKPVGAYTVVEVKDRHTITDGTRRVSVFLIDNPHSAGGVIGHVEDAKLGFVTDLWSPGRDMLGQKLNAGQASVVAGVQKAGIAPERFAGGHGSTGSYPELAALAGK